MSTNVNSGGCGCSGSGCSCNGNSPSAMNSSPFNRGMGSGPFNRPYSRMNPMKGGNNIVKNLITKAVNPNNNPPPLPDCFRTITTFNACKYEHCIGPYGDYCDGYANPTNWGGCLSHCRDLWTTVTHDNECGGDLDITLTCGGGGGDIILDSSNGASQLGSLPNSILTKVGFVSETPNLIYPIYKAQELKK